MPRSIKFLAAAGDRPASIDRLDPIHHTREIPCDGEIAAGQFPQCSDSGLSVIHGRKTPCAKQINWLAFRAGVWGLLWGCCFTMVRIAVPPCRFFRHKRCGLRVANSANRRVLPPLEQAFEIT